MRRTLGLCLVLLCTAALGAQPAQRAAGLDTDWDIAVVLGEMSAHANRLGAAFERVDVKSWLAKGASETYAEQLESCRQQAAAMESGAKALAKNPEKLSESLELLFRIEALESMTGSLEDAMRRYQTPAEAQALAGLAAENGTNRERFRRYIVTLAAEREKQFDVMDREAQRCRGLVMAQPPAPRESGRKK
jgi:hypothetical protein